MLKSYSKNNILKDHFSEVSKINFNDILINQQDLELNESILNYLKKRLTKKEEIKFELIDILNQF